MGTSSHVIFFYACAATLALLGAAETCFNINLPAGCTCEADNSLRCTGLTALPEAGNFSMIELFLFDQCEFKHIETVPNYPKITTLTLMNSKIETIGDNAFSSLSTSLLELDLSSNYLKTISKDILFLSQVSQLILDRNEFSELPEDVFSRLHNLEKLSMSGNQLSSLPDNLFTENKKLNDLEFSFNKFTGIPTAITKVGSSLRKLILFGNQIGSFKADMFKDFPNLEYLDIGQCQANDADVNAFSGLTKINTLRLSNNRLSEIARDTFVPMKQTLHELWLDNNTLTSLENGTIPLNQLNLFYLGHNPWHCDKKIIWMKDLHVEKFEKIDHENVTCATPAKLAGLPLANVTRDVLSAQPSAEDNSSRRSMIVAAIVIPIIVLCVLGILCIVLRLVQNRRRQQRAQVRYSAVYRDTVESARSGSGHHQYRRPTSDI